MTDAELLETFAARRRERLRKDWGSYAPRNPIASDLADCRRYQIVRMLGWKVRSEPDDDGLAVIEHGRDLEPIVIQQLQQEGWEIIRLQEPFEIRMPVPKDGPKRLIVRGKIDGIAKVDGEHLPFDVKSTSDYVLDNVETEADLQKSPWTRKWWRQLQIYLLGMNYERGFLILANRGRRKVVLIRLDFEAAEALLKLCEWTVELAEQLELGGVDETTVNGSLASLGVPYHHAYSECLRCPFHERACFPPVPERGKVQMREDLADVVARYMETKPAARENDRLYKTIKDETEGYESTVAGAFVVEGEVRVRRMRAQPAQPERVTEYWHVHVREVGERS